MDCREEVALIERRFKNLPGLEDFSADLMGQRLHVKYDAAKLSTPTRSRGAIADAGMRAWLEHEEPIASGESRQRGREPGCSPAAGSFFAAGLAGRALSTRRPSCRHALFAARSPPVFH